MFKDMESLQHLRFAELCHKHQRKFMVHALFVADYMAVRNALPHIELIDRAYTLDLLIVTFVHSDVLGFAEEEALQMNLDRWRRQRAGPLASCVSQADYARYLELDWEAHNVEAHVESALLLLSAAVYQAMRHMHGVATNFSELGLWDAIEQSTTYETYVERKERYDDEPENGNETFLMEHLRSEVLDSARGTAHLRRQTTGKMNEAGSTSSNDGVFTRLVSLRRASIVGTVSLKASGRKTPPPPVKLRNSKGSLRNSKGSISSMASCDGIDIDPVELLKLLVRHCIHTGADHTARRAALFDAAVEGLSTHADSERLATYSRTLPLSQHLFETGESGGLPGTVCKAYSLSGLAHLDDGMVASPLLLMQSLGYKAFECKSLATNSKSGEFFFISDDKTFLVKTISHNESILLRKMFTSYQHHIRKWPHSLIVRFGGLFHVEAPSVGLSQYFIVMRSVFHPTFAIHETYDLKGSLFHRKKKAGESIGKDEDWISARKTLSLPRHIRRELSAMHEVDIELLKRFNVMDYSLLVGVHDLRAKDLSRSQQIAGQCILDDAGDSLRRELSGGILSEDGKSLFFVGLIDFLILYDLNKQAENLLRLCQGHGSDASCVSPPEYAMRQAAFIREKVLACRPDEQGTLGMLKAHIKSASNLAAMDWVGTSDPYVRITLGLFARQTKYIARNCNPTFDCILYLPINESHASQVIDVSVWDWDANKALRGNDDFLGRIVAPIYQILNGPVCFTDEPLLDVGKGKLTVTLTFEAADFLRPNASMTESELMFSAIGDGINSSAKSFRSHGATSFGDEADQFPAFSVNSHRSVFSNVSSVPSDAFPSSSNGVDDTLPDLVASSTNSCKASRSRSAPPADADRLRKTRFQDERDSLPFPAAPLMGQMPSTGLLAIDTPAWPWSCSGMGPSRQRSEQDSPCHTYTEVESSVAGRPSALSQHRVTVNVPVPLPTSTVPDSTDPPDDDA